MKEMVGDEVREPDHLGPAALEKTLFYSKCDGAVNKEFDWPLSLVL